LTVTLFSCAAAGSACSLKIAIPHSPCVGFHCVRFGSAQWQQGKSTHSCTLGLSRTFD